MKFIPVVFALLLSAPHATASCVEGSSQEVIPGYEVDFKCNIYRTGKLHKNVATIEKCAQICKDAGSDHCSYGEKQKQCVVGDESGVDKPASGVSYMKRVEEEEDPFAPVDEEDPFTDLPCDQALEGCDGNRKECEADKTSLAEKLDKCEASVRCNGLSFDAAKCSRDHGKEVQVRCKDYTIWCERYHNPSGQKNTVQGTTFPECIDYCSNRSWCSYALWNPSNLKCNTYDRQVPYTQIPGQFSKEWHCAVKKR